MAKKDEGERMSAQDVALAAFVDLIAIEGLAQEVRLCALSEGDAPPRWRVEVPVRPNVSLATLMAFQELVIRRPVRCDYDFDRRVFVVVPKAAHE